jgi:hypothetical protein
MEAGIFEIGGDSKGHRAAIVSRDRGEDEVDHRSTARRRRGYPPVRGAWPVPAIGHDDKTGLETTGQRLTHGSGPICVRGAGSLSSGQLVRSGKAPDELDASQSASKCAWSIAPAASAAVALRSAGAGLARALLVRAFAGHFTSPRWSTIGRQRPRLHMGLAAMSDTRHFLPIDSTIAWLVRLRSRMHWTEMWDGHQSYRRKPLETALLLLGWRSRGGSNLRLETR